VSLSTYNRRGCPPFDAGWFDVEHGAIQRALTSLDAVAIQQVTAPLTFDPTTGTLGSDASATFTIQRTTSTTNSTTTPASAGLVVPVVSGHSYRIQYDLLVGNTHSTTNGMVLSVTYPAASVIAACVNGFTTSSGTSSFLSFVGSGTSLTLGTWVNFVTTTPVMLKVDLVFRNVSGAGNVDTQFASALGTLNVITISDGSCAVAQGL